MWRDRLLQQKLKQQQTDGDDEAVYIRLCLNEVPEARQISAALVVDCRGVYDALARSSSSCLGLKVKKSGLDALALKQSLVECGTMIRWCHSAAPLGDIATKSPDFCTCSLGIVRPTQISLEIYKHASKFESARNRAKRGLDNVAEPDNNEFANVPREPKSATSIT